MALKYNIFTGQFDEVSTSLSGLSTDVDSKVVHSKGALLVGSGLLWNSLAVGTNDQILTADSTQAIGIKWAAAASAGYATIQEEGSALTQRTILNLRGSLVTGSDSGSLTLVDIGKSPDGTDLFGLSNSDPHVSIGKIGKNVELKEKVSVSGILSVSGVLSISGYLCLTNVGPIGIETVGLGQTKSNVISLWTAGAKNAEVHGGLNAIEAVTGGVSASGHVSISGYVSLTNVAPIGIEAVGLGQTKSNVIGLWTSNAENVQIHGGLNAIEAVTGGLSASGHVSASGYLAFSTALATGGDTLLGIVPERLGIEGRETSQNQLSVWTTNVKRLSFGNDYQNRGDSSVDVRSGGIAISGHLSASGYLAFTQGTGTDYISRV